MLYGKNIVQAKCISIVDHTNTSLLLERERKIMRNFVNVFFVLAWNNLRYYIRQKKPRIANAIKIGDC